MHFASTAYAQEPSNTDCCKSCFSALAGSRIRQNSLRRGIAKSGAQKEKTEAGTIAKPRTA